MGEENGFLSSLPCFAVYFGNKRYNTIWKMPSVVLSDISDSFSGPEPWPDDITMYIPHLDRQILMYENACCRAVETFFKMANVVYTIEQRANAEHMSPSGKVPLVTRGSFLLSDMERITTFFREHGQGIGYHVQDDKDRTDMRTYMSTIKTLTLAELYISWAHELTFQTVTKKRYGSVYPFPLNYILPWMKRREILRELDVFNWKKKSVDDVYRDVDRCLRTFSDYLGDKAWFFGDKPTELDALLYGHLFAITTTILPDTRFSESVSHYPNLVRFYDKIQDEYFGKMRN